MGGFCFIMTVWNSDYVETFLNYSLPCQLSDGNIPALKALQLSKYLIYTDQNGKREIEKSIIYDKLKKTIKTRIILIEKGENRNKYETMSMCHRRAIKLEVNSRLGFVFLLPDQIWAEGSFAKLEEISKSGKRAVMIGTVRLMKETMLPVLDKYATTDDCRVIRVNSRDLVEAAMSHFHPITLLLFWSQPKSELWPSHLYWMMKNGRGFYLKGFHLHPLFVDPADRSVEPLKTVDDEYVFQACPNGHDICVVENSDEIVGFELSSKNRLPNIYKGWMNKLFYTAYWSLKHVNNHHLNNFTKTIEFHGNGAVKNMMERDDIQSIGDSILLVRRKYKFGFYCVFLYEKIRNIYGRIRSAQGL